MTRGMRRRRWRGLALAALAVALMVAGLSDAHRQGERRRTLLESAAALGLAPEVAERLRREPDPVWVQIQLARALVAAELDPASPAAPPGERQRLSGERLEKARQLAAEVLAQRPSVWQAPMLLGAATYLARSGERDPLLLTAFQDWQAPLELAVSLAPGKSEPGRFLATAYLELWPMVSEGKRRVARELLADAFEDPRLLDRLLDRWLAVAASREESFAPVPRRPEAWHLLERTLARRGDWEGFRVAWETGREVLAETAAADLEEAERHLAGGDLRGARSLYLRAATRSPPSARGAPVLLRVLQRAPAGPAGSFETPLAAWLEWALDLCLFERCPLPPEALDRLRGLAGELPPHDAALAALLAGRLAEAERLERRSNRLWHPDWAPYLIAKTAELARRGQGEAARSALERVSPAWRQRTLYWRARRNLAEATGDTGGLTEAAAELARRTARRWEPLAWDRRGPADRLEMLTSRGASGLALELAAPAVGAVIEVRLDGRSLGAFAVASGETLTARSPLPPGLHLLEVETRAGEPVLPRAVSLIDG